MSWQKEVRANLKLRLACDRCSSNKVKCSREKPECQRCRSLYMPCNYSLSLRRGKPSKPQNRESHTDAIATTGSTTPSSADAEPNSRSTGGRMIPMSILAAANGNPEMWSYNLPFGDISSDPSPEALFDRTPPIANSPGSPSSSDRGQTPFDRNTSNNEQQNERMIMDRPERDFLGCDHLDFGSVNHSVIDMHELGLGKSIEIGSNGTHSFFGNGVGCPLADQVPVSASDGEPELFQLSNTSQPGRPNMAIPQLAVHDCSRLAMDNLSQLYVIYVPPTAMSSGHPSADQVLKANREVMEAAVALLRCNCTKDFSFPILLGLTACKILAWYQVLVDIQNPDIRLTTIPTSRDILSCPIAFGAYQVDEEVSRAMTSQFVLRNLRLLGRLIGLYVETFCSDTSKDLPGSCEQVYGSMGIYMKTRLDSTIEQLENRLKGCESVHV